MVVNCDYFDNFVLPNIYLINQSNDDMKKLLLLLFIFPLLFYIVCNSTCLSFCFS